MKTPTHIWIFKSNDPEKQRAMQEIWREYGFRSICEFAATGNVDEKTESQIRNTSPEFLDPVDQDGLIQFFGRVDGRAVAP